MAANAPGLSCMFTSHNSQVLLRSCNQLQGSASPRRIPGMRCDFQVVDALSTIDARCDRLSNYRDRWFQTSALLGQAPGRREVIMVDSGLPRAATVALV